MSSIDNSSLTKDRNEDVCSSENAFESETIKSEKIEQAIEGSLGYTETGETSNNEKKEQNRVSRYIVGIVGLVAGAAMLFWTFASFIDAIESSNEASRATEEGLTEATRIMSSHYEDFEELEESIRNNRNNLNDSQMTTHDNFTMQQSGVSIDEQGEIQSGLEDNTVSNLENTNSDSSLHDRYISDRMQYESNDILPTSDCILVTEEDLYGLTAEECKLARNEIFARYGRMFTTDSIQTYFNSQPWYYPRYSADEFNESWLSDIEQANVKMIKKYEDKGKPAKNQNKPRLQMGSIHFGSSGGYYYEYLTFYYTGEYEGRLVYNYVDESGDVSYYPMGMYFYENENCEGTCYDAETGNMVGTYHIEYTNDHGGCYECFCDFTEDGILFDSTAEVG